MPEIRQNAATNEWVIIATERARRPEDFRDTKTERPRLPDRSEQCPFCPGNESKTPPETLRVPAGDGWKVRVTPNAFPALKAEGDRRRKGAGVFRWMSGVGIHEVIVETPLHNRPIPDLDPEHVELICRAYRERYLAIQRDPRIELIIPFKNHGPSAGTSLEHPHGQIVGTPVVPTHIRNRLDEAMRYCDINGVCVFCRMTEEELAAAERIVFQNDYFVAFVPFAAYSPFHVWLLPKRHMASFGSVSDVELPHLAECLQVTLAKVRRALGDPDYNFVIRSIPTHITRAEYFHWYLTLIPRVSKAAGFELGSGMFINTALPEKSAEFLRNTTVPGPRSWPAYNVQGPPGQ